MKKITRYYIWGKVSKVIYYTTTDKAKAREQLENYKKHFKQDEIDIYTEEV